MKNRVTVRGNRDTLYSFGVFDLRSPLTITLPAPEGRYQSLMIVSQDHSIWRFYGPRTGTLTEEKVGTRYALLTIRTFMDPNDEQDMQRSVSAPGCGRRRAGGCREVRSARLEQGKKWRRCEPRSMWSASTVTDSSRIFGRKEELDPVYWMLGTALGWGGLPAEHATYANLLPRKERRQDPVHLHRDGCAGLCLLVGDPLRRRGLYAGQ